MTCGDFVSERVTYFKSPAYPNDSMGTLACDYDIAVQNDICAMRLAIHIGFKYTIRYRKPVKLK